MPLWTVEVMTEIVIAAPTKEAAETLAQNQRFDIELNEEFDYRASVNPIKKNVNGQPLLPVDWELDSRPYGGNDKTVGELLDEDD